MLNNKLDVAIFNDYDIRGIFEDSLNTEDAHMLGLAFGTYLKKKLQKKDISICLGYDGRHSSLPLEKSFIEGLILTGCQIFSLGLCPTPMMYFSDRFLDTDAGVMITGSHNPANYNGFKFVVNHHPFCGDELKSLIGIKDFDLSEKMGSVIFYDMKNEYVGRMVQDFKTPTHPLKVVWDPGNGAVERILPSLLTHLKINHIAIHLGIDGYFKKRSPDPTKPHALDVLCQKIIQYNADVGIAFDGDGDRIIVVDDQGHIMGGDELLIFFGERIMAEFPEATIIADIKSSQRLFSEIARLGGHAIMSKTGHTFIKTLMHETKAILGGEMSGHMFFADHYFGYDDGIYAAIRLLSCLGQEKIKLSQFRASLPQVFSTTELRIPCTVEQKTKIIHDIKEKLNAKNITFTELDGIRVDTPHGWWLLRSSNTENVLCGRCESTTEIGLDHQKKDLQDYLKPFGLSF